MKSYKQYLLENDNYITVYHGDNHNTTKLDPKLMANGNNQEGIGIYFANRIKVAEEYGKDIVSAEIDTSNFVDSRDYMGTISDYKVIELLKELSKVNLESMFYYLSDRVYLEEPEDIEDYHYEEAWEMIKDEEIRNFQVDMVSVFNVESFVELWNKIIKIDGTYHKQTKDDTWYVIINPNIEVKKVTK